MRRQDIQLRALARQGDVAASCELGRRYLLGVEGLARHMPSGLEYLERLQPHHGLAAARVITECLQLQDILVNGQLHALQLAAAGGHPVAQFKLGVWCALRQAEPTESMQWLERAREGGHLAARRLVESLHAGSTAIELLRSSFVGEVDTSVVAILALQEALDAEDVHCLPHCLKAAMRLNPVAFDDLAAVIVRAVLVAERLSLPLPGIDPLAFETSLDIRARRGDADAAFVLGRALCGVDVGALSCETLVATVNMRRGVATLFRAADAGRSAAWLHLHRAHADNRLSVANAQMARFCLEKAAIGGEVEAQRRLGAVMLRDSDSLVESEQAIGWLHQAAQAGDASAVELLQTLVLPLGGDDDRVSSAIDLVQREDPWLAVRLQLSRQFGLTRLEALCVDPSQAVRPWGIVVGRNPFIVQSRLSAARAIPALSVGAARTARHAASMFARGPANLMALEGDLRRRSLRQRRAFERHELAPEMFFSSASSSALESLRLGAKWAHAKREPLQRALAG